MVQGPEILSEVRIALDESGAAHGVKNRRCEIMMKDIHKVWIVSPFGAYIEQLKAFSDVALKSIWERA